MQIDTQRYRTADGYSYRVLATDLGGDLPVAIFVNGEVARLRSDLSCPANEGYSLTDARAAHTRFFNVYRAADGGFCFGSRAFQSNQDRTATQDSRRALFGLQVNYNEATGEVTATRV